MIKIKTPLKEINKILKYLHKTGRFIWVTDRKRSRMKKGSLAGCTNDRGYVQIKINCQIVYGHRLAWFMYYGYESENLIDHKDRNSSNNRIINLREASHSCNMKNRKLAKNNKTGVVGIRKIKKDRGWVAHINNAGRNVYLGYFLKFEDAVLSRFNAEIEYEYFDCLSNSSAYQYLINNNIKIPIRK